MADKFFDYLINGGDEADKQAATVEYMEGVLGSVVEDMHGMLGAMRTAIVDIDSGDYAAAKAILKTALRE